MKKDLARILGGRVRDLRETRGLTQEDFAKTSGVPIAFLRRVERGEVKNPSLERLQMIAVGFDVSVESLFKVHEKHSDMPHEKVMLIESIERMLRLHSTSEIRAIKSILREVFVIQRLGRK